MSYIYADQQNPNKVTLENGDVLALNQNPFFDLATLYYPKNIKDAFMVARTIFLTFGIVRQAISKLAEYAITDLEYHADESDELKRGMQKEEIEKKYKTIFEEILDIKSFLISVGLDYYVFGNAFVNIYFPFRRVLTCEECAKKEDNVDARRIPIETVPDWEYSGGHYRGTCPDCGSKVNFNAEDVTVQKDEDVKLIRWCPDNIEIFFYPFTGVRRYEYSPDYKIIEQVMSGDRDAIANTPTVVIQAIENRKRLKLNSKHIFHFMTPSPSDFQQEWGKAIIICAFKTIFYATILRKSAEAIAMEQITPLRILFPEPRPNAELNIGTAALDKIKGYIEKEITRWRRDKNYIALSPIPIGQIHMAGQGRPLLPTPEIQQSNEEVMLALGLPQGLIMGQAAWASNSISMRIVENAFLTYRDQIQAILAFISRALEEYLNLPPCKVKMKPFKMLDDMVYKQMMGQLASSNMISRKRYLDILDIDYEEEQKQIEKEMIDSAKSQARAQLEMIRIQNEVQAEISMTQQAQMFQMGLEQQEETVNSTVDQVIRIMAQLKCSADQAINMVMSAMQQQSQMMAQQAQQAAAQQAQQLFLQDRMASTAWSLARAQGKLQNFNIMSQGGIMAPQPNQFATETEYINRLVSYLLQLPQDQRDAQLESIKSKDAVFYERVANYLNSIGVPIEQQAQQDDMLSQARPLPEQAAPRRQGY